MKEVNQATDYLVSGYRVSRHISSVKCFIGSLTEREVLEKRRWLRKRFKELKEKVKKLAEKKWDADSFSSLLCSLTVKYKDEHISFVKKEIPQFSDAKTVKEIFLHLDTHWSFLSTGLLDYILDMLEDEEGIAEQELELINEELKRLNEDVTEFRKTTPLTVYWKVEKVDPESKPIPNEKLYQVVETRHKQECLSSNSTLEDVEHFRKRFAAAFTIDEVALCISKISPGSVQVSWSVPSSVAPLLLADMQEHPEKLEQLGLISASLGSISVYSQGTMKYHKSVDFNVLDAFFYRSGDKQGPFP